MARNDILVKLKLAGEEFSREFDRKFDEAVKGAEGKSEASGKRAGGSFAKGFLGAAGIAALGTAIGAAISQSADLGAEIASTSRQFNIGAEELQVWRFAAQQAGVTASEFDGSLGDLTRKIGAANAGNRAAQQGFVDLGLSFQTASGQARATDAVMRDLADQISKIEDPSERVRLGTQLLGEEFQTIYPLLLDGAAGFDAAAAELDKFGGVLSREEIQNLEQTNAKIEQMKSVLSIKIAGIVADNADAIIGLTVALADLAVQSINAANGWLAFRNAQMGRGEAIRALPAELSPQQRAAAIEEIDARAGRREVVTGSLFGGLIRTKRVEYRPDGEFDDVSLYTDANRASLEAILRPTVAQPEGVRSPRLSAASGRRGASPARAAQSAPDREAERAAQAAIRNEDQLRQLVERTITAQEDSAEVERVRAEQGDVAAAAAEAQLSFLRQNPLLVYDQVDALAAALGITKQLTDQDRERLQVLIEQGNAAEAGAVAAARTKAQEQQDREAARQEKEAQRAADRQAEYFQRAQEIAILDIADLYQTAMRGGVDDLWDHFKDEGIRIIAEIAATWTLSMLSGNPFNAGMAAQGEQARSPLSSIFFGSGFGGAANDNGFGSGIGGIFGAGGPRNVVSGDLPTGGGLAGVGANTPVDATLRGGAGNLQQIGAGLALSQLGIGIGGNSGTFGQIGGMAGGLGGMALGKTIGALGGVGGPVGAVVGSLLGNIVGGLFSSTSRGSAIIGNSGGSLGVTGFFGNSASRKDAAAGSAGSLIDAIYQIADQLGGGVDASRGRVSIGVRNDSINVDPQGRGFTKTSKFADIRAFGQDEEAAIEFAIRDLISDGVLTGISQVSQNLLNRPGTDLETQIEKALLIEQVPRLLKQRLDPLGAALDEVYDKFKLLADALKEGGASAEEVAQAQRLYELEKAEAIASIGAASQTLKDFLDSLNAGSNSPLSLRQQRTEAEAQLAPFLEQIAEAEAARAEVDRLKSEGGSAEAIAAAETAARTAAAAIDQSAFTDASQLLLSISRQANASTSSFFSDFDRIRALTGQAIGFVDAATPTAGDGRDPFSAEIAKNTADAAYIQSEHTVILRNIEALLAAGAANNNGSGGGFIGEARAFAR